LNQDEIKGLYNNGQHRVTAFIPPSVISYLLFSSIDIMQFIFFLAVGLGHLSQLAQAVPVCAGKKNTAADCNVGSPFPDQSTFYYNPTDQMDIGAEFVPNGHCDYGSYAPVTLNTPSGRSFDCGCLSLTGDFTSKLQTLDW
jgi:hypothetical protein